MLGRRPVLHGFVRRHRVFRPGRDNARRWWADCAGMSTAARATWRDGHECLRGRAGLCGGPRGGPPAVRLRRPAAAGRPVDGRGAVPRAAGGGTRRHGDHGRHRDDPAGQRPDRGPVRLPPRGTAGPSGGVAGTAPLPRAPHPAPRRLRRQPAGAAHGRGPRTARTAQGRQRVPRGDQPEPAGDGGRPAGLRRRARRQRPQGGRGQDQRTRRPGGVLPGRHPRQDPGRGDHVLERRGRPAVRLLRRGGRRPPCLHARARRTPGRHLGVARTAAQGREGRALRDAAGHQGRLAAGRRRHAVADPGRRRHGRRGVRHRPRHQRPQAGGGGVDGPAGAAAAHRPDPAAQPDGHAARAARPGHREPLPAGHPGRRCRRRLVRPDTAGCRAGRCPHRRCDGPRPRSRRRDGPVALGGARAGQDGHAAAPADAVPGLGGRRPGRAGPAGHLLLPGRRAGRRHRHGLFGRAPADPRRRPLGGRARAARAGQRPARGRRGAVRAVVLAHRPRRHARAVHGRADRDAGQ
ncbi:hypothetical protein SGPA1_20977 [Streptomyces misionensis JCM 4497]